MGLRKYQGKKDRLHWDGYLIGTLRGVKKETPPEKPEKAKKPEPPEAAEDKPSR